MVFYRKYRPQKIEELDSKDVRDKLFNVLERPSFPHAFLFTGAKGLGKTSTARIVAKSLNCEKKLKVDPSAGSGGKLKIGNKKNSQLSSLNPQLRSVEPCNKCHQCISITSGTNMDMLEIDGASNRGIDEIRDLREKIKLSPMSARIKVYIIDEVHMLTQEAFNALLKTLEEPPGHVVFILCTTEPHKVPGTIISRCLRIQFKKATEEELVRSFERIIKAEKLAADKEALKLIAGLSDGSFRDGVKILEEMVHLAHSANSGQAKDLPAGKAGKKISKELIEQKYQIASIQYQIAQMIRNLETKDTKSALEVVAKLTAEGVEMKYFMEELVNKLHSLLLAKIGVGEELEIVNCKLEIGELKNLIEMFSKAASELKYAVLPQLPLELAIIEWTVQKTQNTQKSGMSEYQTTVKDSDTQIVRKSDSPSFPSVPKKTAPATPNAGNAINITQQGISNYSENDALWTALIDKVKTYNHSVAGVLRGCSIKSYDSKVLLLQANFKFHKDKLSETKTKGILENALREVTKKNIKIELVLRGGER